MNKCRMMFFSSTVLLLGLPLGRLCADSSWGNPPAVNPAYSPAPVIYNNGPVVNNLVPAAASADAAPAASAHGAAYEDPDAAQDNYSPLQSAASDPYQRGLKL